ncbi:MAG: hypothetical protein HZB68_00845 [Candidatus Aenigmarchaeota archaeon]|nr:hypothetical protein [Candidatus Aenigmarchaeota archaeon]
MSDDYSEVLSKGGYYETSKIVYRVSGEVKRLLEGTTSNFMDKGTNAFLDRFGKLIVIFEQKIFEKEAYIVFESGFEGRFLSHIDKYAKLSRCTLEKTSLKAFHVIGNFETTEIKISQRFGFLVLSKSAPKLKKMAKETYDCIRIENGISVQGKDFDDEMFLNVNWNDAVSYSKGCFVGQEVMSRVRAYGKPVKKLVAIAYGAMPPSVTSNGMEIGKITSSCLSQRFGKYLAFSIIPFGTTKIDNGEIVKI